MTVIELKELLEKAIDHGQGECEVKVREERGVFYLEFMKTEYMGEIQL